MLKLKPLIAFALGVVLTLATVQAVQRAAAPSAKATTLSVMDYIEIQQLVARYPHALNSGADNGYSYADLFVPDGVFIGRLVPYSEGREQLAALGRLSKRFGPSYVSHFAMNHVIEPSPEGATGKQFLAVLDIGENGKPSLVNQGGRFDDVYVKTSQGWRFKKRTYIPSQSGPQPAPSAPAR